ncbi:MAG: T9SS type A sorting domain-containing protein, partial [Marinilabiliaceae bacterium]|nr:T9SS type A sorting domain-containing protein [Marinilabiliaceae bacterium]
TYTVCSSDEACLNLLENSPFKVAYKAATCVFIDTIKIENTPLTAEITSSPIKCSGDATGNADVTITSGTPPYQFIWNTGDRTEDLYNKPAGLYSVVISDANGQSLELTTEITQPTSINIIGNTLPTSCSNDDGSITTEITGGIQPYSINWNHGDTVQNLSNLASGYYLLKVTDASGCSKSAAFNVATQSSLVASISSDLLGCHEEGEGQLSISVSGGDEPYSYQWDNGGTTTTATGLNSGSHNVIVTDSKGCTIEKRGYVLLRNLSASASVTSPTCSDESAGSISISIKNGTEPYDITWSTGDTTRIIDGLTGGWYWVEITDANGCTYKKNIQVPGPKTLSFTYNIAKVSCDAADSTILVNLNATGGSEPYTYYHNDVTIANPFIVNSEGNYDITVVDANGCTTTETISIIRPESNFEASVLVKNPTCESPAYGSGEIIVSKGVSPYTATWSDGSTEMVRHNLAPGEYQVSISDAIGCSQAYTIQVKSILLPYVEILPPQTTPECQTSNNVLNAITENTSQVNWAIKDTSASWRIQEKYTNYIVYDAGEGTAHFILEGISTDGCTHSDTLAISCQATDVDNPTEPTEPDDEEDKKECEDLCYYLEPGTITHVQDDCYEYMLTVHTDGTCPHELSHLVLGIDEGTVSSASNSKGWKQELNLTDPTTGIYGFKIDNISGFGKDGNDQFNVTFTICGIRSSAPQQFTVAYKSGQCIQTDTLKFNSPISKSIRLSSYPNPFIDQTTIQLIPAEATNVELIVYDIHGQMVEHLYSGSVETGKKYTFEFFGGQIKEGIYFYRLVYGNQVKQGKLMKYQ